MNDDLIGRREMLRRAIVAAGAVMAHPLLGSGSTASDTNPGNNVMATLTTIDGYVNSVPTAPMAPQAIGPVGGSQPHTNFQPYLCVDFIISLYGLFPSPT